MTIIIKQQETIEEQALLIEAQQDALDLAAQTIIALRAMVTMSMRVGKRLPVLGSQN
jgi:hypothetical protein